ncbi:hypothetical protein BDR06DRAFT_1005047 [Suillus hirtellus]|nr:hypothetical protein BDR06DRAFT_1005047 [Suillus hirtellus]
MSVPDSFGLQLAKYTNVAGLTILIYDYFVTLHSEIQWTWGRKWGITRTVFMFSRYGFFACALMTSYSAVKTWGTQDCAPFNDVLSVISTINVIVTAVLPLSYSETLNTLQIVAHSILASRILSNLQESMAQPLIPTNRSTTSIELQSRPHKFKAQPGGNETAGRLDEP